MSVREQILEMHTRGGRHTADTLFLEIASFDLDLHAKSSTEAIDIALAGMLAAVEEINHRLGVTDKDDAEAMSRAAVSGFQARWSQLCSGTGGRA